MFGSRCFLFNSKEHWNKFDEKLDEGIFPGYSLTSKAYRVLNKKSKKIQETYYVMFDDNYMKKCQKRDCQSEEIFQSTNSKTTPLMNLYEDFLNLFDEHEREISSESKAKDNRED